MKEITGNDWYEEYIEPEIREIVKHLRNNGINTECSCGHDMYIQCQFILDGTIFHIHQLLYNYFHEKLGKVPYYKITAVHEHLEGGFQHSSIEINLKDVYVEDTKDR